jgi:acetate CoA/acetoacetate CoA-transferase alpha subunit
LNKEKRLEEVLAKIKDGSTIMIGGFLGTGTPHTIVDALVKSGKRELTIIANDTATPDLGIGKLIVNKQVKKVIATHIGTNPETGRQMIQEEMEVELVPQGTLAERIRAGGSGIGGVLTPTGVGTVVEEGKEVMTINGKQYLLELPIRADLALINAYKADKAGNLVYRRSAKNFNPIMALAADEVVAEVEQLVEVGEIDPDMVITPGILVDHIVVK